MTRIDTALNALCSGLRSDTCESADPLTQLDEAGWLDVIELANNHRLGPALFASLASAGRLRRIPEDVHDYLVLLYRANRDRNTVVRQQAIDLIAAFNRARMHPLLLKGVLTLVAAPCRDPATRIMSDIDIAVPPGFRRTAERVLGDIGYRVRDRYPDGHHAIAEFCRSGDPAAVDLHIELIDQSYLLPAAEVFARAHSRTVAGVSFAIPDATDRLLHALLHAQVHHLGQYYLGRISLAQLHDFRDLALPSVIGAEAWAAIDNRLTRHGLTGILDSYLFAAERLLGFPWPLDRPPLSGAGRQLRHWRMQLRIPALAALTVPAGNLRAAFALHRMHALYGDRGNPMSWRLRHVQQYLGKHRGRRVAARLLRGAGALR